MKPLFLTEQISVVESNASLLNKVALGQQEASAFLYDRHASLIYTAALDVLGNVVQAERILHDVCMQVWRSPDLFVVYRESLGQGLALKSRKMALMAQE